MRFRTLDITRLKQADAEVVLRHRIISGNLECMLEKGLIRLPVRRLIAGTGCAAGEHRNGGSGEASAGPGLACGQFRQTPDDHNKKAGQRNIGVTVRHGLLSDLDQADNRDQRAQVPEPAHRQVALLLEAPRQKAVTATRRMAAPRTHSTGQAEGDG